MLLPEVPLHDAIRAATVSRDDGSLEVDMLAAVSCGSCAGGQLRPILLK